MRFRYSVDGEYIKMHYYRNNFVLAVCNMIEMDDFFIDTDDIRNNKFLLKIIEFLKSKDFIIFYNRWETTYEFGMYENYKLKINNNITEEIDVYYFLLKLDPIDILKFKMLFPLDFDEVIYI